MLKVVGASWLRTVVSFSVLVGILIFGILLIVIYSSKNLEDDGKYAATVSWNPYAEKFDINLWGQNNDPDRISRGVARAYYQPCMRETGWAVLEIESNAKYSDKTQAFAAGILEGCLSWKHIYWHWKNTVEKVCEGRESFCEEVRGFLKNNTMAIRKKALENDRTDPFWHQVNLFYLQLEGIEYGWKYEVERKQESYNIPFLDFLWMNIVSDLKDLEKPNTPAQNTSHHSPAAMSLLKLLPEDNGQFLLAHASSGFYSSMLRIQKKYKLGYHVVGKANSNLVPGQTISFTSYPASIHSQDDFYQIFLDDSSRVTITGTALNFKLDKMKQGDEEPVLLGPRVMAGNRLARNGKSWTHFVSQYSSGIGNKQWLHIHSYRDQVKFWVLEQTPKIIISKDETNKLYSQRYWISCGIPYYKTDSQVNDSMEQTASGKIIHVLKDGQRNVSDMQSLVKLMRGPELALAGRTDLLDAQKLPAASRDLSSDAEDTNSVADSVEEVGSGNQSSDVAVKYVNSDNKDFVMRYNATLYRIFQMKNVVSLVRPVPSLREVLTRSSSARRRSSEARGSDSNLRSGNGLSIINGIIDLKVARENGNFLAAAGPPFNLENKEKVVEPFQWSKSRFRYLPHNGHSDVWDFQPVAANFVWD